MSNLLKICLIDGCAEIAVRGTTRCPAHPPRRSPSSASPIPAKLRAQVLKRDPVCRVCRTAPSVQCDHVEQVANGGATDLANLRGVCSPCHKRRHADDLAARKLAQLRGKLNGPGRLSIDDQLRLRRDIARLTAESARPAPTGGTFGLLASEFTKENQ
jgi:5-methylcytosine-specific restriction enzyme A